MNACTLSLLNFIKDGSPFEISVFQSAYSWEIENCENLWEDAMRVGRDRNPNRKHFIGSVIYIEDMNVQGRAKRFIIDGKQRLATVTLLIEALARSLDAGETVNGLSADELRNQYILNPNEFGDNACRLLLNKKDRETLKAVLDLSLWPDELSLNIQRNFDYFMSKFDDARTTEQTKSMSVEEVLAERRVHILNGLRRLNIVAVELDRERENPQIIFENMNTKKRSLDMSDLIRNYVLLDMDIDGQTEIYNKHWRPMEEGFEQGKFKKDFNDFIRYYLAFKNSKMPVIKRMYAEFQNFASAKIRNTEGMRRGAAMKKIVADLQKFAGYFCKMKLEREENPNLKKRFQAFQELKVNVLFPLLLGMYEDYAAKGILSAEQFEESLGLLESFMLRRAVCGIPPFIAGVVPRLHSKIQPDQYLESFCEILRTLPMFARFPKDEEFQRNLLNRDIGALDLSTYLLRRLEQYESDAQINLDDYEVERIMPLLLSDEGKQALGPDFQELHERYVNKLGNLTLMKKEEASTAQAPFHVKREAYRKSGLWLNNGPKGPARVEKWNVQAIQERAKILMEIALYVWPTPWRKEPTPSPIPDPINTPTLDPITRSNTKQTVSQVSESPDLKDNEAILLDALTYEPQHIDAITQATGLSAQAVSTGLLSLELANLAKLHPGMRYSRKR